MGAFNLVLRTTSPNLAVIDKPNIFSQQARSYNNHNG